MAIEATPGAFSWRSSHSYWAMTTVILRLLTGTTAAAWRSA